MAELRIWYVKVPPSLDEALERLRRTSGYATKAEVLRDLVRRECERRGIKLVVETAREV